MKRIQPGLLVVTFGLAACAAEPAVPHSLSDAEHGHQEIAATALTIEDGWTRREAGSAVLVESPPMAAPSGASRVSAMVTLLAAGELPTIEARPLIGGEPAAEWAPLAATFSEGETHVAELDFPFVAEAAQVRLRAADVESIVELRWAAVPPLETEAAVESDGPAVAGRSEALRTTLRGLGIVPREEWGARATSCSPADTTKRKITIHHTEGGSADPPRQLRGIQAFHISKGWCDIGYHFLIGADGRIYEGRNLDIKGTHTRDNNTANAGIALIGCFDSRECSAPTPLTDAMLDRTGRLVGTLARLHGITPSSTTVLGHRDQVSTTCPGNTLYSRLPAIIDLARRASLGMDAPMPPPAPPAPPAGSDGCTHSLGGTYGHAACSTSYQCCDGAWRTRGGASACGACACVEGTGRTGCTSGTVPPPAPPPAPPPVPAGDPCTHSFGGLYGDTACSASYQCCDGAWRTRGGASACGACACVEESGSSGCGMSSTMPPAATGPYQGLSLSGSEIPRAGLTNPTLRATLGISTEPQGTVVTVDGRQWVSGRVSWFGGPRDTGVTSTETVAITGERARSLNSPVDASDAEIARRPGDFYYAAMRWSYTPNGRTFWRDARILIRNPRTGVQVVVRPADWGPNTSTRRILDLSPEALEDLGMTTDDEAHVAFARPGTPLGVVR